MLLRRAGNGAGRATLRGGFHPPPPAHANLSMPHQQRLVCAHRAGGHRLVTRVLKANGRPEVAGSVWRTRPAVAPENAAP